MALNFLYQIPEWMLLTLRKEAQKRKQLRNIRKASLMIDQMPDWQKKDLNLSITDLRDYKHRM